MKKFFKEFRDFALRGNMLDLAIGVIIGAAFQGVVSSLTDNIISPILGLFTQQNFDNLKIELFHNMDGIPEVTIKYGAFITTLINFIIMAFVVFLLVKGINKLTHLGHKEEEKKVEKTEKTCPYCHTTISIEASRCPNCTSQLADVVEAE